MTFLYKRSETVWSKIHMELDRSVGERLQFRRAEHGSHIWRLKTPQKSALGNCRGESQDETLYDVAVKCTRQKCN